MVFFHYFVLFSIFALSLVGCRTTVQPLPPPQTAEQELNKITSYINQNEYSFSDGHFLIKGNNKEITDFIITDPKADIQDLAAFSIALYRKELVNKLRDGNELTGRDLQLLRFSAESQLIAINAYTYTLLRDMLEDTDIPTPSYFYKSRESDVNTSFINKSFDDSVKEVFLKMQDEFANSNSITRQKLREWGLNFQPIEDEFLVADLFRIQDSLNQKIDYFQWRQMWLYVPYVNLITLWWEKDFHEEPQLRPYKAYGQAPAITAMQWHALHDSMKHRIAHLVAIHEDTVTFLSKTAASRSMAEIDDFRLSLNNEMRSAIMLNAFVYNDLPFAVFSKKAYVDIQRCKGYLFDDDDAMENVMNQFLVQISGVNMLSKIRSPHSADIYAQLLKLIKSEWSDKRYNNYLLKSKIYELDQFSPTYYLDNTVKQLGSVNH